MLNWFTLIVSFKSKTKLTDKKKAINIIIWYTIKVIQYTFENICFIKYYPNLSKIRK